MKKIYFSLWNAKGVALGKLGKHKEAIECFDNEIKINPDYVKAWNNKGDAFYELGNYDDAEICYDEANRLSGKSR